MLRRFAVLSLFALLPVAPLFAQRRHATPPPPPFVFAGPPARDIFSNADLTVTATHIDLDLTVDFDKHQIRGSASETLSNPTGATKYVVDTRDLTISSVKIDGETAKWSLGPSSGLGLPLTVEIRPTTKVVRIDYASGTNVRSQAMNWLTAMATDGDTAPFLYTYGEPDRTRDWIPIQDTPVARVTYTARVQVPRGMLAVMSCDHNPQATSADGSYSFSMTKPIPAYLIALAAGRMEFRPLSDRTGFYAEPENVDDALSDLRYLPDMFDAAQRLLGPYPFDRYDVVLMPPNFHAGGMENPNANFINVLNVVRGNHDATPYYSNTVSHELAHAWTGDLVTCATWGDAWLNEGFATYYQGRILDEMGIPGRGELEFYFDRTSYEDYSKAVSKAPATATMMHRDLTYDDNVGAAFNGASYAKGGMFLKMLEDTGGRPAFDAMMRDWLVRYRFRWVDHRAFVELLREHYGALDSMHVDEWIYGSGMPPNVTIPPTAEIWTRAANRAAAMLNGTSLDTLGVESWTPTDRDLFIWACTTSLPSHMAEVDAALHMSSMKTAEGNWWVSMASTMYAPGMPGFEAFLLRGGGNVQWGYQELIKTPAGLKYAVEFYKKARPHYDWGIQSRLDAMLHYSGI